MQSMRRTDFFHPKHGEKLDWTISHLLCFKKCKTRILASAPRNKTIFIQNFTSYAYFICILGNYLFFICINNNNFYLELCALSVETTNLFNYTTYEKNNQLLQIKNVLRFRDTFLATNPIPCIFQCQIICNRLSAY